MFGEECGCGVDREVGHTGRQREREAHSESTDKDFVPFIISPHTGAINDDP